VSISSKKSLFLNHKRLSVRDVCETHAAVTMPVACVTTTQKSLPAKLFENSHNRFPTPKTVFQKNFFSVTAAWIATDSRSTNTRFEGSKSILSSAKSADGGSKGS